MPYSISKVTPRHNTFPVFTGVNVYCAVHRQLAVFHTVHISSLDIYALL